MFFIRSLTCKAFGVSFTQKVPRKTSSQCINTRIYLSEIWLCFFLSYISIQKDNPHLFLIFYLIFYSNFLKIKVFFCLLCCLGRWVAEEEMWTKWGLWRRGMMVLIIFLLIQKPKNTRQKKKSKFKGKVKLLFWDCNSKKRGLDKIR